MRSKDAAAGSAAPQQTPASNDHPPSLYQLLKDSELLSYHDKMKNVLKLRHAGDLAYTEEKDLTEIGMSRPEQKRLRREYGKYFPQSSFVVKLRKVFGKSDGRVSDSTPSTSALDDSEQHIIPAESINLCKELGKGEFGCVFQAAWHPPHSSGDVIQVAVKRVLPEKLVTNPMNFLSEAAIMTKMRHEHVIRLYGVVLDTKAVMLVSELAPCGSLLECLQKPAWREPFPVDVLCDFALQIALGMQYLASQRLIHRDLAARNVLVCSPTKVKISDFGLSRSLGVGEDYYRSEFVPSIKLPIAWCAPECINYLRFTTSSDVWAFGVTLWEMFSYGKMPFHGFTGAQILHAIDTQRKRLDCPDACPAETYKLMMDCWMHEPDRRPTFDDLVSRLPDIAPQLLVTVEECHNGQLGRLQYDKGQIVILLDKNPSVAPSGDFWHGALKNGQTGLFKPAETVAYLGAENPSPAASGCLLSTIQPRSGGKSPVAGKKEKSEKDKEKSKVLDKERKKLLISEPQGDLRHTCHVGIDGKMFGLIVKKDELAKALPPMIAIPPVGNATNAPSLNGSLSPSATSVNGWETPLRGSSAAPSPAPPPRPAPRHQPPPTPPSSQPPFRYSNSENTGPSSPPMTITTSQMAIKPPALPPKPARTSKREPSAPVSDTLNRQSRASSRTESDAVRRSCADSEAATGQFSRPESMLASTMILGEDSTCTFPSTIETTDDSANILDRVLSELQQDITDFSMSTIGDFTDTRPLLDNDRQKEHLRRLPSLKQDSLVRQMTDEERDKLDRRALEEHKKAAKTLAKEIQAQRSVGSRESSEDAPDNASTSPQSQGSFSGHFSSKPPLADWSDEAQEAYKRLIECGDFLKSTSPTPERRKNHRFSSSSTDTEATIINSSSLSSKEQLPTSPKVEHLGRKIEYINNRLVGSKERPLSPDHQYQNSRNGEVPAQFAEYQNGDVPVPAKRSMSPPVVPPKPGNRPRIQAQMVNSPSDEFVNGSFAPAVQRTALFSGFPKDEIVKF
ncbi:Protein ARK-1 a [Aphelenchoides avenae]|nr:Protein ARK-1 a [Aphelenchus avenae]